MKTFASILIGLLFVAATATAEESKSATQIPPAKEASSTVKTNQCHLLYATGGVEISAGGKSPWKAAEVNQVLKPGDKIRTGEKGRAAIRLPSAAIIRVPGATTFEVPAQALAKTK